MDSSTASRQARSILMTSDAEWQRVKPLTGAADDAELDRLRDWYRHGIPIRWGDPERHAAAQLFDLLARIGGQDLVGADPCRAVWNLLADHLASRRLTNRIGLELPTRLASALVFLIAWQIAADLADSRLLPTVTSVLRAMLQQTISARCLGTSRSPSAASQPHSRCRCCWAARSVSQWDAGGGSISCWTTR